MIFEKLKRLLTGGAEAVSLTDAASFAQASFYFLSLPERFAAGLPVNATPAEILDLVKEAAAALASSAGFEPWGYDEAGRKVLPLFTSRDHAQQFLQAYVTKVRRILPFQALKVEGRTLVPVLPRFDEVLLNPGTKDAATLHSKRSEHGEHGA